MEGSNDELPTPPVCLFSPPVVDACVHPAARTKSDRKRLSPSPQPFSPAHHTFPDPQT